MGTKRAAHFVSNLLDCLEINIIQSTIKFVSSLLFFISVALDG